MIDGRPWRDAQDLLEHVQAALGTELKVEKRNIIAARFQLFDRQRAAFRSDGFVTHRLERHQKRSAYVLLVVNNQSAHAGLSIWNYPFSSRDRLPVESGSCALATDRFLPDGRQFLGRAFLWPTDFPFCCER